MYSRSYWALMDCGEVGEYSVCSTKLRRKMGDMGYSCAEAQVTARHAASGNSERRKSWCGFPKTLECEKWGGCFYNCAAALHAPTFATLPLCLPPQPSRFPIHIHTRFRHQSQTRFERWRRRRELVTQRRRAPESAVTKSGCRRVWGRRGSIDC